MNSNNLTPHQQEIFNKIISLIESKVSQILKSDIEDYLISLSGPAGTGKTYLTTQIAKYLSQKKNTDYSFVITAPTHKAVGVLSEALRKNNIYATCKTIHSFLGIKAFKDYYTGEEKFKIDRSKKFKESTSILIVDESSMVSNELYEYILESIKDGRVNLVLFIGDPYQLLPVGSNENNIFQLKYSFELKEVVRQAKDSYIINIATDLRTRIQNKNYIDLVSFFKKYQKEVLFFHNKKDFLEDFYKEKDWYKKNKILATYKNKDVDSFNRIIRNKYWEQQNKPPTPILRRGDKIKFIEAYNIKEVTLYYNGQEVELAEAKKLYHESLEIEYWECKDKDSIRQQTFRVVDPQSELIFNEKLDKIAKQAKRAKFPENKKLWELFFLVRDMFAKVQYIYSSTIHKLQGSTYEIAYIDLFNLSYNKYLSDEDKYRLVYVAVTRARKDIKIFLPAFDEELINVKQKHKEIDKMLEMIQF